MSHPPNSASNSGGGITGWFIRFYNFLLVFLIGTKWNIIEFLTRHRKMNLQVMPKRAGETAVITGARGIGAEVIKQFMILDMHVIIGCRKAVTGIQLIDKIRKEGIQSGSAEVLELDLNSFTSVRAFAQNLIDRSIPINILVNNAGIMFVPYGKTVDNFESHFQTNYLSHFLLTDLLMPLLVNAGSAYRVSRVVNVSSCAHFGGKIDFDDLNMEKMYDKHMAYMASKLCQVVSAKDLNARLKADGKDVRIYSVHPGVIYTELYSKMWYFKPLSFFFKKLFKTPEQGADGIVFVAASPEAETDGGEFFINCKKQTPNPIARDPSIQQKLWSTSQSLVGLKSSPHKDTIEIISLS